MKNVAFFEDIYKYAYKQIKTLLKKSFKVKFIIIICFLHIKAFSFQNTTISNYDTIFSIQEGVTFIGLEKDDYVILNKQDKVYVLPNTTFVGNVQLSATIKYLEKENHHSIVDKSSKKILKSVYTDKKVGKSYNSDLLQIKLPSKDRQNNNFLLSVSDYVIIPSSNHHNKNTFDKNKLLFLSKQVIADYKQQNFIYHQFIKAFALNILLLNKPPPITLPC